MEKKLSENEYKAFITEIKARVYQSQHQALRRVNQALIGAKAWKRACSTWK